MKKLIALLLCLSLLAAGAPRPRGVLRGPVLLAGMLGEYMGPAVTLIDPGRAAADDLDQLLAGKGLRASRERGGTRFYVSDVPDSFIHTADLFLGEYRGGTAEQICIDQY